MFDQIVVCSFLLFVEASEFPVKMKVFLGLLFDVGLANESCAPSCGTCVLEIDFRPGDVRSFSKQGPEVCCKSCCAYGQMMIAILVAKGDMS